MRARCVVEDVNLMLLVDLTRKGVEVIRGGVAIVPSPVNLNRWLNS
jgi:hypothetical protein